MLAENRAGGHAFCPKAIPSFHAQHAMVGGASVASVQCLLWKSDCLYFHGGASFCPDLLVAN